MNNEALTCDDQYKHLNVLLASGCVIGENKPKNSPSDGFTGSTIIRIGKFGSSNCIPYDLQNAGKKARQCGLSLSIQYKC